MSLPENAIARLNEKSAIARRVFATSDGKDLLKILEDEFIYGQLVGTQPVDTYFNLGAREVVIYLRQLANFGERK